MIILLSDVILYSQNRMNYELRAVWLDYSRSIFGAEHMRQVGPLETRNKNAVTASEPHDNLRLCKIFMPNLYLRVFTTFNAEIAAKYGAPV